MCVLNGRSTNDNYTFASVGLINNNGLVEQLDNRQTVETVKHDSESNSLAQADIDRIYEDFSDLVYSEMLLSIPPHNLDIGGNTTKKSVDKLWWTAELTGLKMIVWNAEGDCLTDKINKILKSTFIVKPSSFHRYVQKTKQQWWIREQERLIMTTASFWHFRRKLIV